MKSDLNHYFENNANIVELINKFKERRFTKYYLTFLFYLEYSEISKITHIDDILNNFENSLDLSFSYTLDDATDFLIENTSKGYIDYIRSFRDMEDYAMKMYLTKSFEDINKLFFKHDLYKPNQLYYDCYKSIFYNIPKFEDDMIIFAIFKALYYKVTSNYKNIIENTDFKNKNYFEDFKDFGDSIIPKTINESINILIKMSSKDHIDFIKDSNKEDYCCRTHFNLGMYVRNNFFLQGFNHNLFVECLEKKELNYDLWHIDRASGILIEELWEYVQKNYEEIIANTMFENKINMTNNPYSI